MKFGKHKIVVVGALHHDIVVDADRQPVRGETLIGSGWHPKFGGKGGNQAIAASKAGAYVAFIGAVGDDALGKGLLKGLNDESIDVTAVAKVGDAGSGMSVAIVDAGGDYSAVVVSGANQLIDPKVVTSSIHWKGADAVILQNEVPEEVNKAAAEAARANGVSVIWNAAPAREDTVGMMDCVDVLIVNAIEAEQMTGITVSDLSEASKAARHLMERGVGTAIVTAGAAGVASAAKEEGGVQVPAEEIESPKAHGAGDVFTGVVAVGLAKEWSVCNTVMAANSAAADHVRGQELTKI